MDVLTQEALSILLQDSYDRIAVLDKEVEQLKHRIALLEAALHSMKFSTDCDDPVCVKARQVLKLSCDYKDLPDGYLTMQKTLG